VEANADIATRLPVGRSGIRIPAGTRNTTQAVEPTQPPVQKVPGFFLRRKADGGLMLTAHLHLLSRSRMSGAVPVCPPCALMALTEHFTLFFTVIALPSVGGSQGMIFITSYIASTNAV